VLGTDSGSFTLVVSLLSVATGVVLGLGASVVTTWHAHRLSIADESRRQERAALIEMGRAFGDYMRVIVNQFGPTRERNVERWWHPLSLDVLAFYDEWSHRWRYDVSDDGVRRAVEDVFNSVITFEKAVKAVQRAPDRDVGQREFESQFLPAMDRLGSSFHALHNQISLAAAELAQQSRRGAFFTRKAPKRSLAPFGKVMDEVWVDLDFMMPPDQAPDAPNDQAPETS
jgi:hypothetical protein